MHSMGYSAQQTMKWRGTHFSAAIEAGETTSLRMPRRRQPGSSKFTSQVICLQFSGQPHAKEKKKVGQRSFPECSGQKRTTSPGMQYRSSHKAAGPHSRELVET